MVGLHEEPVAVPLAFERPLACLEAGHRTLRGEHRGKRVEVEDVLVFHPVRQPLVAVGLNQRVAPRDSAAVQGDDDLIVQEFLGLVGARIPDDHLAGAVFASGDVALERGVFQRMILGVHRQVVHRRRLRQVFGHRPRHQHAVSLQPEVVVQPARVVLLDDERIAFAGNGFGDGHRLRRFRGVAHAAVRAEPVADRRVGVQPRQQIAVAADPLEHLVVAQLAHLGVFEFLPRARRRDRRMFAPAQRVRRNRGFRTVVLAPIQEHLAGPQALGHRRRDQLGHRLFQLLRNTFGEHRGAPAAHRVGQRRVEVQSLAAAGQRERGEPDVCDQIPHGMRHFAQLGHRHALARIQVEHQSCRRAGLAGVPD